MYIRQLRPRKLLIAPLLPESALLIFYLFAVLIVTSSCLSCFSTYPLQLLALTLIISKLYLILVGFLDVGLRLIVRMCECINDYQRYKTNFVCMFVFVCNYFTLAPSTFYRFHFTPSWSLSAFSDFVRVLLSCWRVQAERGDHFDVIFSSALTAEIEKDLHTMVSFLRSLLSM